jgi:hypothetical protein
MTKPRLLFACLLSTVLGLTSCQLVDPPRPATELPSFTEDFSCTLDDLDYYGALITRESEHIQIQATHYTTESRVEITLRNADFALTAGLTPRLAERTNTAKDFSTPNKYGRLDLRIEDLATGRVQKQVSQVRLGATEIEINPPTGTKTRIQCSWNRK